MRGSGAYTKIPSSNSGTHSTSTGLLVINNASSRGVQATSPARAVAPNGSRWLPPWAWLNIFQFCRFLKYVGHAMVLLVLGLLGFSFFVVVIQIYGPGLSSHSVGKRLGSAFAIGAFCLESILMLWSYFTCVATDGGRVPLGWHPFSDEHQAQLELERMSYSSYYFDRRDPRRPRFCKRCQAWKPERAHHCSVSGRCVLRMDHYCIWVINCVGLNNYKAFLLFLFYTLLACTTAAAFSVKPMINFFTKPNGVGQPLAFIVVVIDTTLALSIVGFLIMHIQLIATNCTTIEMYEKDRLHPWPYNRGFRRNFEEVFGRSKLRWFLPYHTKEERRALLESCLGVGVLGTPFASAAAV